MPGHDIVVVGASAGGVEALAAVVGALPADLPAAVFVVLHVPPHGTSALPRILSRAGPLPALHPQDGEAIVPGRVYVAPPDRHLLVQPGHIQVARGPRENGHRPAIDALFRTAARAYGPRVAAAVLSGVLDDGTAGLTAVKRQDGVALVQDPSTALYDGMPRSALEHVAVDYCLPLTQIGPALARLAREAAPEEGVPPVPRDMEREADIAGMEPSEFRDENRPGTPSVFGCPECNGVLWELRDGELLRFRCRVGHAYSAESLLAEQSDGLETALWTALRALEEKAALARRLAEQARATGRAQAQRHFALLAEESAGHIAVLRQLLVSNDEPNTEAGPPPGGPEAPPAAP
jgi:two-component system chemotaxis response regulator CheB